MKNQEFASVIPDGFNAFCQHVPNDTFIVVRQGAIKQFKLPITSEDDSPVDDGGTENNHVPVKGDYLVFVNEEDGEFTRQIGNVYPAGEKHVYVDLLPYNTIQDPPHPIEAEKKEGEDYKDLGPDGELVSPMNVTPEESKALKETFSEKKEELLKNQSPTEKASHPGKQSRKKAPRKSTKKAKKNG